MAPLPGRPRLHLPALAARVRRRCTRLGGVPSRLRRGMRARRRSPSAQHHRRRSGRAGADQVRQPTTRRIATSSRSGSATTSGASCSPSPARDRTWPACAPAPSAPPTGWRIDGQKVWSSAAAVVRLRLAARPYRPGQAPRACRCSSSRWTSRRHRAPAEADGRREQVQRSLLRRRRARRRRADR